jgi:chalcone isomerase-like protein
VSPGDRYALTYVPDVGTELRLNEESLATIPGEDFAEAYFGIWLGDQPLDEGLRDKLLGAL